MEVRDRHRRAVAAVRWSWGQPDPGGAGEGGEQPRQSRGASALPEGVGPVSVIERSTRGTSVVTPLNAIPARIWWMWAGSGASLSPSAQGTFWAGETRVREGHGECLRRSRGDAAGAELGSSSIEGTAVNTGTVWCRLLAGGYPARRLG